MTEQSENLNLLTAQIGDKDMGRQAYPVRVTLGDGSAASDWLRLSDMAPPPPARSTGDDLVEYGLELFARLFSGPLQGLFRQAWIAAQRGRGVLHLQLWIQSDDPDLQAIPWELLHMREGAGRPLALAATPQVAFSRYLDSETPFGQPIERWPLRVLIAIGAPNDLPQRWPGMVPVDYEAERAKLDRVLRAISGSGQIEYRFLHPATPEGLTRAMEDGYQIVIFYGHGLYMPRLGTSLMMERDDGGSRLFAATDLIDALRRNGSRPALFILISCNTAAQRANPALDNLAIQIVRDGSVPAVVAMRDLVAVDLARAFTQYLCDYLLRYGAIDRAVAAARRQVMSRDTAGWSTPVLYMRSRDGRLFVPNAQLEFARLLSNDPQLCPAAQAAPAGPRLALLRDRPDEQPNPQDAYDLLDLLLAPGGAAPGEPVVVSGGSRISRSLLLQQWGWRQNRPDAGGGGEGSADGAPPMSYAEMMSGGAPALDPALGQAQRGGAPAPPPARGAGAIAVYLPLADDRQLQAGAWIEDLLIDAAAAIDPTYGVALLTLLAPERSERSLVRAAGPDRRADRFVLLVDGFEAVSQPLRASLAARLRAIAGRLAEHRVVVSVDEGAAPAALRQGDTPWLLLQPLSERQMRAYLSYRDRARRDAYARAIVRCGLRDLAGDPQLLTAIFEVLDAGQSRDLSRDSLLSEMMERLIDRAAGSGASRAVARECLYALAWALHWGHRSSLTVAEAYQIIRATPRDGDYEAEDIYRALVGGGALVELGGAHVQLTHHAIQAYVAARALRRRPDMGQRIADIVVMASFPDLLEWWSPVMMAVAQRTDNPGDLAPVWTMLRSEVSGPQALLAARCLGALPPKALPALGDGGGAPGLTTLLDSILIELDPRFEPGAATRAQLAEALGQMTHLPPLLLARVREALRRQIGERVLLAGDYWTYDRPMVRAAAARSLRDLGRDTDDSDITGLLKAWTSGDPAAVLEALRDEGRPTEARILAAFALSDLSDRHETQARLVELLLHADEQFTSKKDTQAVQAAIADALVVEADKALADRLAVALAGWQELPLRTEVLLLGVVGACSIHRPELIAWLHARLEREVPLVAGAARAALARAWALSPASVAGGEALREELAARSRAIIEEPMANDAPLVASLRRLAIETLVWLGDAQPDGEPPAAIASWPVALRQSWWDTVGYSLG